MAWTINNGKLYFNTTLYTGNGSEDHTISGVGFQSDWTWIKSRSDTSSHQVTDSVRGVGVIVCSEDRAVLSVCSACF